MPPEAGGATLPPSAAEAAEPPPEPARHRKLLYVTLPGCWGALIGGCLSFTPSLLPRSGTIQGVVWGITAAIGYGLGVLAAWIWRAFADREPRRPRRRSWTVLFITAAVLILVAGLAYLVVSGLLLQGFVNVMNSAYSLRDTMTAEGIHQPTTSLRSGGPGSVIPWDSLGWQGRNFIGKGPSVSDIEKFTGQPAMEPIRIYAGLASAPDAEARADLD